MAGEIGRGGDYKVKVFPPSSNILCDKLSNVCCAQYVEEGILQGIGKSNIWETESTVS